MTPVQLNSYIMYDVYLVLDIDECAEGTSGCEMNCNNTIGSYFCSCNAGFIIDADGRTCDGMLLNYSNVPYTLVIEKLSHYVSLSSDIDECRVGTNSCEQVCNNTHGSHYCLCPDGYRLRNDNYSCAGRLILGF